MFEDRHVFFASYVATSTSNYWSAHPSTSRRSSRHWDVEWRIAFILKVTNSLSTAYILTSCRRVSQNQSHTFKIDALIWCFGVFVIPNNCLFVIANKRLGFPVYVLH